MKAIKSCDGLHTGYGKHVWESPMNITYLASPSIGFTLTAEAKEINRTNKTVVYEIKVVEGESRLLVSCQALVHRLDKTLPFLDQD
jgi:uncharacterized protein (TIGR00369 family)